MQRDDYARRNFRALHEVWRLESGHYRSCHQLLIAAVDGTGQCVHTKIKGETPPGRLIHGTESRFRGVAKHHGNLGLRVHEVLVTSRGKVGAKAVEIVS